MAYIINLLLRYIEIYYISVAQIYIERYIIYLLLRYISVAQMYRMPGMGEPGGLLSMGSHRVGHA